MNFVMPPIYNPLMKLSSVLFRKYLHSSPCFLMNICVQIVLCFLVYVPFYRIYSNSQVGTSSCCYDEDIDDTNETTELEHDIEGLE